MIETIRDTILKEIPGAIVYVDDPNNDGEHFQAIVISDTFNSMSLVKQHQLVMNSLKQEFATRVHALQLKTFTPEKWEQQKDQYLIN